MSKGSSMVFATPITLSPPSPLLSLLTSTTVCRLRKKYRGPGLLASPTRLPCIPYLVTRLRTSVLMMHKAGSSLISTVFQDPGHGPDVIGVHGRQLRPLLWKSRHHIVVVFVHHGESLGLPTTACGGTTLNGEGVAFSSSCNSANLRSPSARRTSCCS